MGLDNKVNEAFANCIRFDQDNSHVAVTAFNNALDERIIAKAFFRRHPRCKNSLREYMGRQVAIWRSGEVIAGPVN